MYSGKLKSIRVSLGLKQNEMARLLEISPAALSKLEHGYSAPCATVSVRLIAKCRVNLNWLHADRGAMFIDTNHQVEA